MRQDEVWSCCRQLAVATRAGLPVGPVLDRLPGKGAAGLRERLRRGDTVAGALRACGAISPPDAARLEQAVRAGEGGAVLAEMAEASLGPPGRAGEEWVGLAYPLLVLMLGGVVATLVGRFLLPALLPSFRLVEAVAGLPPATRLLLWAAPRWGVGLGVVVLVAAGLTLCVTGRLGWWGDRVALALPGVGRILLWRERSRLLDSLARMSSAGGLTGEGASSLLVGCGNGYLRRRLAQALVQVRAGLSPASALASAALPPALAAAVWAAQQAGEAGAVCRELAVHCRGLQRRCEKVTLSLLEPGLTLLAAAVVAVVALAVVQPLYLALAHLR